MSTIQQVYLDYAAATPVAPAVRKAMQPFWSYAFGNPSSLHAWGQKAAQALADSRAICAQSLNARADEIIFTSGGTESINLALKGYAAAVKKRGQHIITTRIEHAAARASCAALQKNGRSVTYIPCNSAGLVDARAVISAVRTNTRLISVIMVQNEIGTIQPIAEIGRLLININRRRAKRRLPHVTFHTDACQTPAWTHLNVEKLHVDLLSLDAGKMYGPKGVGLLYKHRRTSLTPLLHGGEQERGTRSGTEPVALIVGLAAAFSYVRKEGTKNTERIQKLRDYMMLRLEKEVPGCHITGDRAQRIANNIHVTIPNREGDDLVFRLDKAGIAASTGSACSSAEGTDSHVMKALKLPHSRSAGSLRFTFGYTTTKKQADQAVYALKKIVRA